MQTFGGDWTKLKLDLLRKYLVGFNSVLKNQPFERWYVDAFAGSGHTVTKDEHEILKGSPLVALECVPEFHRLLFIEAKKKNIDQLQEIIDGSEDYKRRARLVHGDANQYLVEFCQSMRPNWRAVVFLDPYAMAVDWSTMQALAKTQRCDVWVLFPLSSINRLLTHSGERDPSWTAKLGRVLGTDAWGDEFYTPTGMDDMFTKKATQLKDASADDIAAYYHGRLGKLFAGSVGNKWRVLKNSKNSPMFALMFALGNPSVNAKARAMAIANHLLDKL